MADDTHVAEFWRQQRTKQPVVHHFDVTFTMPVQHLATHAVIDMGDWPLAVRAQFLLDLEADDPHWTMDDDDRAWCHWVMGCEGRG